MRVVNAFPTKDVASLQPKRLYRSYTSNMPVCEYFVVYHDTKRVFMIQVTHRKLKDHIFNVTTVFNVLSKLSMVGSEVNKGYKLCLICVVDWLGESVSGIAFANAEVPLTMKDMMTLRIQKNLREKYGDRLETYIVRACISTPDPAVLLKKSVVKKEI